MLSQYVSGCFFNLSKSILNTLKNIPYKEMRDTNSIPKNNFVLNIAKTSSAFDTFIERTCITEKTATTKIANISSEKTSVTEVIIKNQNENPEATARALNLGEDKSILYGINKCHEAALRKCS